MFCVSLPVLLTAEWFDTRAAVLTSGSNFQRLHFYLHHLDTAKSLNATVPKNPMIWGGALTLKLGEIR